MLEASAFSSTYALVSRPPNFGGDNSGFPPELGGLFASMQIVRKFWLIVPSTEIAIAQGVSQVGAALIMAESLLLRATFLLLSNKYLYP
jgi:hypothetical protein